MFLCQKCRSLRVILSHTQVPQGNRYLLNHQLLLNAATRKQAFSSLSVIKPSLSWTNRKISSSLLSNRPVSRSSRLLQRKLYVSSEDYATDFPEPRFLEHEEDYSPPLHHEELEAEPEVLFEDLPATLPEKQNTKKKNEKTQTSGKKKRKSAEGPSDTGKTQNALTKPLTAIHSIKGKDIALERSFKSFFEICIHQGMFDRAYLSLKRNHEKGNLPSSTSVYDTLLRGAARLARWRVYQDVRGLMKERDIKPSLGSFAAGFECLGRSTLENASTYAANLLEEMQNLNFKPGDVYEHCRFAADEMDFVTKGLRFAVPDFVPQRSSPLLTYSCHLTKDLNNLECGSSVISPAEGVLTNSQLADLAKQQLETELNGFLEVKSVANQVNEDPNVRARSVEKLETLEESWREVVTDSFEKNVRVAKAQFYSSSLARKPIQLYPYLVSLPKEEFVQLVMQDIRTLASGSETFSPSLHLLCRQLGARVMQRFHLISKQDSGMLDKIRRVYSDYCTWYMSGQEGRILNPRQKWQELLDQNMQGPDLDAEEIQWPYSVQSSIGHLLYNIILKDLKIAPDEDGTTSAVHVPAFYVVYRNKGVKLVREVKPHPSVSETYTQAAGRKLSFDSLLVPMLSPPLPWTSHRTGGYLLSPVPLIRLPTYAHQQRVRVASAPQQQLYPALDCLNALGSVPWKINTRILDLVVHVFNNKGDKKLEVPQPPSECPVPPAMEQGMSSADRAMVYKERQAARRRKAEMYSIWCDTLYRLSLANHFRDKVFWLPHNMDFRGRVYPCPPHLTHLSSDLARSLLVFALGKPLGPKGLDWLKIHVINLTGLKKRDPVSERLKYADEIMPEILDSADHPLTGNRWWVNSDEPWQTLATCMEIAGALRSPNPEEYVCHLPIHQDGSCNGLQHYAALGRDTVGGESVNLAPAERPQDVYSSVAALVERERAKDAAAGLEIAKVLEGHIKRKVIKQTVMTTVYGVTQFGARLQIAKQLEDLADFPHDHVWAGAMYLAGKTFQSLGEMFTSAKVIQDWFTDCARLVSSVCCQNVEWVTPLGLPVVQPYTKAQIKRADKEESYYCDSLEKPNALKQRNAFPPNFIHSLDSSHMMLTSLFSQRAGITFASIHDCFWTHACTVNSMNKICRQQFVALHSEPILENLSRSFINLYAFKTKDFTNDGSVQDMTKYRLNRVLTQVPRRGDFDLNQVLNSVYFFS